MGHSVEDTLKNLDNNTLECDFSTKFSLLTPQLLESDQLWPSNKLVKCKNQEPLVVMTTSSNPLKKYNQLYTAR